MESTAGKIPLLHMFWDLKRKFPGIKDDEITNCIKMYGRNPDRCYQELTSKHHGQSRGYSQRGQSRVGSRSSSTGKASPGSPGNTPIPSSPPAVGLASVSTNSTLDSITSCYQVPHFPLFEDGKYFQDSNDGLPQTKKLNEASYFYPNDSTTRVQTTSYQGAGLSRNAPHDNIASSSIPSSAAHITTYNEDPFVMNSTASTRPESPDGSNEPRWLNHDIYCVEECSGEDLSSPNLELPKNDDGYKPHSTLFANPTPRADISKSVSSRPAECPSLSSQTGLLEGLSPTTSGIIREQIAIMEKLKGELTRLKEEKAVLGNDVVNLRRTVDNQDRHNLQEMEKHKKFILDVQTQNGLLQAECDHMEREILDWECPQTDNSRSPAFSTFVNTVGDVDVSASIPKAVSNPSLVNCGSTMPPMSPLRRPSSLSQPPSPSRSSHTSASFPPDVDESQPQWACPKCTYLNSPLLNECEMCRLPHFSHYSNPTTVRDS